MRADRVIELLLLLQLRGRATAGELAAALEVSVRTVHRDIAALAAAGVPIYTETGRNGGVRLQDGYRVGGLPRLDEMEARGMLLAAMPAVARDLGIDPQRAEDTLLTAMEPAAEAAARSLRDRLLIEPDDWFRPREATPLLLDVARAVWEAREVRLTYRRRGDATTHRLRPLGLVLKGPVWYLIGRTGSGDRMYRIGRMDAVDILDHRFDRPVDFELEAAWAHLKARFIASIPAYFVTVRVAPDAEPHLHLLQEGTPELPLPADTPRDEHGWASLRLRFERPDSAARLLLQLGGGVEVVEPSEVRELMAAAARAMYRLYERGSGQRASR